MIKGETNKFIFNIFSISNLTSLIYLLSDLLRLLIIRNEIINSYTFFSIPHYENSNIFQTFCIRTVQTLSSFGFSPVHFLTLLMQALHLFHSSGLIYLILMIFSPFLYFSSLRILEWSLDES